MVEWTVFQCFTIYLPISVGGAGQGGEGTGGQ